MRDLLTAKSGATDEVKQGNIRGFRALNSVPGSTATVSAGSGGNGGLTFPLEQLSEFMAPPGRPWHNLKITNPALGVDLVVEWLSEDGEAFAHIVQRPAFVNAAGAPVSVALDASSRVPVVPVPAGWELIQQWLLPAADASWAANPMWLKADGTWACQAALPNPNGLTDVRSYRALLFGARVGAITGGATLTAQLYPCIENDTSLGLGAVSSSTGGGPAMVANTACFLLRGQGAGAGTTTTGQMVRDDMAAPFVAARFDVGGAPAPASMGVLRAFLYGRR